MRADFGVGVQQTADMPRVRRAITPRSLHHSWYLREWMAHFSKRQADLVRDLDWHRATASEVWNGRQRYTQDMIDELAVYLNLRPFELLLPPEEAMAIRRMRDAAVTIAADNAGRPSEPRGERTGTDG